jgi:hypothetical protein
MNHSATKRTKWMKKKMDNLSTRSETYQAAYQAGLNAYHGSFDSLVNRFAAGSQEFKDWDAGITAGQRDHWLDA